MARVTEIKEEKEPLPSPEELSELSLPFKSAKQLAILEETEELRSLFPNDICSDDRVEKELSRIRANQTILTSRKNHNRRRR